MLLRGHGDCSANRRRENKGLNRIVYCDASNNLYCFNKSFNA